MSLRPLTAKDIPSLLTMVADLAAWHDEQSLLTAAAIQQYILGQPNWAELYGWVNDLDQLLGFIGGYNAFDTPKAKPFFEAETLFVQAAWRGQNIGRKMLNALAELKFAQGAQLIKLGVRKSNETAVAFYRAMGGELHDRGTDYRVYFYRSN